MRFYYNGITFYLEVPKYCNRRICNRRICAGHNRNYNHPKTPYCLNINCVSLECMKNHPFDWKGFNNFSKNRDRIKLSVIELTTYFIKLEMIHGKEYIREIYNFTKLFYEELDDSSRLVYNYLESTVKSYDELLKVESKIVKKYIQPKIRTLIGQAFDSSLRMVILFRDIDREYESYDIITEVKSSDIDTKVRSSEIDTKVKSSEIDTKKLLQILTSMMLSHNLLQIIDPYEKKLLDNLLIKEFRFFKYNLEYIFDSLKNIYIIEIIKSFLNLNNEIDYFFHFIKFTSLLPRNRECNNDEFDYVSKLAVYPSISIGRLF